MRFGIGKVKQRNAWCLALQLHIEIFMRTNREQHQLLGGKLIRLQSVGQQGLAVVELEFVDENTGQVAPLFFAETVVTGDGFYGRIQGGFVLWMQLLGRARKGGRDQNG